MIVRSRPMGSAIFLIAGVFLLCAQTAQAFRSTKQESFTDPDYIDYQPSIVLIQVMSGNLEIRKVVRERLARELVKRGIEVYFEKKLFPPTRHWDSTQRAPIYQRLGIQAVIIVGVGASSYQVSQIGSQTWGSATATSYGNTATAYGSSTTIPIVRVNSSSSYSGVLIDITNGRIAWTTDIYTKAGGLLFAGGKKDAKAAAKAIINGLVKNNHIPKK